MLERSLIGEEGWGGGLVLRDGCSSSWDWYLQPIRRVAVRYKMKRDRERRPTTATGATPDPSLPAAFFAVSWLREKIPIGKGTLLDLVSFLSKSSEDCGSRLCSWCLAWKVADGEAMGCLDELCRY